MRTEQDLHAALATREELAPAPEVVLDGARQAAASHRRRRTVTAGAIAAATAAVVAVIAVPAVLTGDAPPEPEPLSPGAAPGGISAAEPFDPAEPRPPFAFTIPAGPVAGFEIEPVALGPDHQIANILRPGEDEPAAFLVVYDPGARARISAGGAPRSGAADSPAPTLQWEYTPDGHAEIVSESDPPLDQETLQTVADSLELVAPYQARIPYRLDYLPAGTTPFHLVQETGTAGGFRSVAQLEGALTLDITIADEPTDVDDPGWDWQPTTIAGRPAECVELVDGHRCRVEFAELTVSIGGGDADELERIIAGLHPATWEDPATWYEIDDALPAE